MSDYKDLLDSMEQWRRHTKAESRRSFLLMWEKSSAAGWFGFPLLEKVLTFIDADVYTPMRDARIVLWGASAADLRDVVCAITASNGDGDFFQRLLIVPIGDGAAALRLENNGPTQTGHLPGLEQRM